MEEALNRSNEAEDTLRTLRRYPITEQEFYRRETPSESGTKHLYTYERVQEDSDALIWEGLLRIDALKRLLQEDLIKLPTITAEEINDKSKGDALSKGVALLQLTWFVIQIVARSTQGLAISELELTTAALAGLNSIMYFFWWSKPRDVGSPVLIRTKHAEELLARRQSEVIEWKFMEGEFDFQKHLYGSMKKMVKPVGYVVVSFPFRTTSAFLKLFREIKLFFPRIRSVLTFSTPLFRPSRIKMSATRHTNVREPHRPLGGREQLSGENHVIAPSAGCSEAPEVSVNEPRPSEGNEISDNARTTSVSSDVKVGNISIFT